MRKLVILRGAMGCGKSTFIKENNLEVYTLSTDTIRLMFNTPVMTVNYQESIPQFNNKKVWDLLFFLLEERMKKGEFTIIDAVHANFLDYASVYKKLAEKYRYRLYVLDFTEIEKEEVYRRNLTRENYKIVPEYAIDRAYKAFAKEKIPSSFKIIKPDDFLEIVKNRLVNFDKYEKVHIIGDIHGCFSALNEYFSDNPIRDSDAYIFVGDYFDRGVENAQTFKYLSGLMDRENMCFLLGNHEDKLYKYACDDAFKMDYDIKMTIKEFDSVGIKKSEIRGFIKKLSQMLYFKFANKTYLVTHGGIPYIPSKSLDFLSTDSFVYGVSDYEVNIDEIFTNFMAHQQNKTIQIHGHRNFKKIKGDEYEYSYNLDGDIEHGGCLRILTLTTNSEEFLEIKNEVYDANLIYHTNVYNLVELLRRNKYILEKDLGNNLFSYNFSKEAFYNRIWDNMTIKARGLFIDTENSSIVARSYDKFFNVNERRETKLEEILDKFIYPVSFYLKYNGFLGILSVKDGNLFFASKSTNEGNYVEYFKSLFYSLYGDAQINEIRKKITDENLTLVFEVIDPINDPHIIKYGCGELILLEAIKNEIDFSNLSYKKLSEFAECNNMKIKKLAYEARNSEEFMSIYNEIVKEEYHYENEYVEGFVLVDDKNFMVKVKTGYYNKWKYLRSKMEQALKNNDYSSKGKSDLEKAFLKHLEIKYKDKDIDYKLVDIISERDEFDTHCS